MVQLYAVVNGDIIGSTRLSEDRREFYLSELKKLFDDLKKKKNELGIVRSFEVYRGDSFQGALKKPEKALRLVLFVRSYLRMITARYGLKTKNKVPVHRTSFNTITDIRMAVGIGKISKLARRLLESDGEAFHRSGRLIDSMKKSGQNIAIETPWEKRNTELEVFCGLLDSIISRWSPQQAEVVYHSLQGHNQTQIAETLQTSISAVNQRLKTSHWASVDKLLTLFETRMINGKNE
jgi:hypothetical protein